MTDMPRRRGRPPANPAPVATEAEPAVAAENLPGRRRRASVGGMAMKLFAPARDGFVRRWFNDKDNRIAEAEELAYTHVTDPSVKSSSSDSRISRLVGTKPNGEPLSAFLMETPVDEYAAGRSEKETQNRMVDEAITAGRDSTGQMTSETYGRGSIQRDR